MSARPFPWLNLLLFLLTLVTTFMAGASMAGAPLDDPAAILRTGWVFSVPLILVLGTHEMGHFIVARGHGLYPSWPYFIPAPTFIGTFGAVIRMRYAVPPTRSQLFDVGIAGPLAGFVVSVVVLAIGAAMSEVSSLGASAHTYTLADAAWRWMTTGDTSWFGLALGAAESAPTGIILGDSLLVKGIVYAVLGEPAATVQLHPVGLAGWVGLFVTTLNLLPIGQLDGGHVAYALLGRRFRLMPYVVLPGLVLLGLFGWLGWLVWAALVSFLGVRHPPASGEPLGGGRMALAWACLVIFVLIFTPVPLQPAW